MKEEEKESSPEAMSGVAVVNLRVTMVNLHFRKPKEPLWERHVPGTGEACIRRGRDMCPAEGIYICSRRAKKSSAEAASKKINPFQEPVYHY